MEQKRLLTTSIIMLLGLSLLVTPLTVPPRRRYAQPNIPLKYLSLVKRLHLYVHETGEDYAYPDSHVRILTVIYPENAYPMLYLGFEDLEDMDRAQWNDCFLNLEFANGVFWVEGRMTGAYHKTFYVEFQNRGRVDIAKYFEKVWFTVTIDLDKEEVWWGEYWE